MNYKQIIANAIDEYKNQKTTYSSYFTQNANKANKDHFVEFKDFFDGCKVVISDYKKNIEKEFNKNLTENDWALRSYKQMSLNGEKKDQNGQLIQEHIEYIENEKEFVKERGYKTNSDYSCLITEFGSITQSFFEMKYKLYYSEIEVIEKGILQSENCIEPDANLENEFKDIVHLETSGDSDTGTKQNNHTKPVSKTKGENMDLDLLNDLFVIEMTKGVKTTKLDQLKTDLRSNVPIYNGREITALANVIYESAILHKNTKPKSFNKWLNQFCSIIDVQVPTTHQNAVQLEIAELKKTYYYLNFQ